jgi:hypothetical protein
MSANRSVQAAQRRRAGPTSEPGIPGRGPQPSINSAQLFSNQARPGQGPSMPTGRLAGQQAEMHQKQQMQQMQQQKTEGISSVSKMTIPQAITLITLRLGALESKIINLSSLQDSSSQPQTHSVSMDGEDMVLIDKSVLQSITSRLESLEKRSGSTAGSASGPEMNLLKQQFETVKQAVVQTKSAATTVAKESKDLKIQVDTLKNELSETKELLTALQNLTMDNTQKIMDISSNMPDGFAFDSEENFGETTVNFTKLTDLNDDSEQNEIVGTNLKELIESEINAAI